MRELRWQSWPVSLKLTVIMTILVIIAVETVTVLSIRREQETFRRELEEQAVQVLNLLQAAIEDNLYALDADGISDILEKLGDQDEFLSGRVYNPEGQIISDAFTESLTVQEKKDPLGSRLVISEGDIFLWELDRLTAGRAIIVGNQNLGAISISLSTAPLGSKIISTRNQGLVVALFAAAFGAVFSLLLSRSITHPLQKLVSATQRIADGDMSQPIQIDGQDEIGRLAISMEQMRGELNTLYIDLEQQVTERTQELVIARDRALEVNRLKSELLSRSSHELRTPLNAILGYAEMLEEGTFGSMSDTQKRIIKEVIQSTHKMTLLIEDLLDQSRLEAGRMDIEMKPFSPQVMLEDVRSQLQVLATNKGLQLLTEVAPNIPLLVKGDLKRVEQIVVNLVGNAIKFTEEGEVILKSFLLGRTHWVIAVQDSGIGIPEELQETVFEPFRQVDGSIRRKEGGTGLGLSIVRELVNLMAGEIELESQLGQGSTFTVYLPLIEVSE